MTFRSIYIQCVGSSTFKFQIILVAYLAILYALVFSLHDKLPEVLSDEQALKRNDFPGNAAFETVRQVSKQAHPVASAANVELYNWINGQLADLAIETNGRVSLISTWNKDLKPLSFAVNRAKNLTDNEQILYKAFLNQSQIFAILPGTSGRVILLASHYDSVPNSPGASDDGMGVGVILETFRTIARRDLEAASNTLVVFFNNGEENGLDGSRWAKEAGFLDNIYAFVNVEAGGAGGKPILLRSSSDYLTNLYASSVPYPHMNSVGGFLIGALGSKTDWEVFNMTAPGLDISIYESRHLYHTPTDDLSNLGPTSVQQFGSNVLAYTRKLLQLDEDPSKIARINSPYYDHMGFSAVVLPFPLRIGIFCLITVLVAIHMVFTFRFYDKRARSVSINPYHQSNENLGSFAIEMTTGAASAVDTLEHPIAPKDLLIHMGFQVMCYGVCFVTNAIFCLPLIIVGSVHFSIDRGPSYYYNREETFKFGIKSFLVAWTSHPLMLLGSLLGASFTVGRWKIRRQVAKLPNFPDRNVLMLVYAGLIIAVLASISFIFPFPFVYIFVFCALPTILTLYVISGICYFISLKPWHGFLLYAFSIFSALFYPMLLILDGCISLQRVAGDSWIGVILLVVLYSIYGCLLMPFLSVYENPFKSIWKPVLVLMVILNIYVVVAPFTS